MKCRILQEMLCVPSEEFPGAWRCRQCGASGSGPAIKRCPRCESPIGQRSGRMPAGTVLEFPEACELVRRGAAVPADEECEQAVGMDSTQLSKLQLAYQRVSRGIHPDDYQAYDEGLLVGYNPDGSWKPGPNYDEALWQERKRESPLIIVEDE